MIKIYPTTESGLSHSEYSIELRGDIYPQRERPQRVRTTLSNNAVVTPWVKSQVGSVQTIETRLKKSDFELLRTIVEHTTVFKWVVCSLERIYVCTLDIMQATPVNIAGVVNFNVQLKFTVTEVLS